MKMRGCHCEPFDCAQDKLREAISVENVMLIRLLRRSAPRNDTSNFLLRGREGR
jgi:hypothetical protein